MGYGDILMAMGEAKVLHAQTGKTIILEPKFKFLYANNHYIKNTGPGLKLYNVTGNRPYIDYFKTSKHRTAFKKYRPIPAEIIFTPQDLLDIEEYKKLGDFIFIEPHTKIALHKNNRDWGFKRFKQVTEMDYQFIQPQYSGKLLAVTQIETPTFWEAIKLLSVAKTALFSEGGMMHAAAALSIPSVVIFGGLISPEITGYDQNTNIYAGGEPCGSRFACNHCRKAMGDITPEKVIRELKNIIG